MIRESNCSKRKCIHYIGVINDGDERTERHACKAFRDGIPDEIAFGDNKHDQIHPNQTNEIIFEKE